MRRTAQRRQRLRDLLQLRRQRGGGASMSLKFFRRDQPVAKAAQIARAAALQLQPRQRAAHIGRALEHPADALAKRPIVDEHRDRVEPPVDQLHIRRWRDQPVHQLARAGRGHRAVDGRKYRRRAFVLGPHQLQARARRRVDEHERARRLAFRRAHGGPLAHLREVHIMEQRADGGEIALGEEAQARRARPPRMPLSARARLSLW